MNIKTVKLEQNNKQTKKNQHEGKNFNLINIKHATDLLVFRGSKIRL